MLRHNMPTWRGYLLFVAVVAVMITMANYAVRHAREASHQQTCANNLKLMGQACKMYQEDWHDVLVPYGAPFHSSYLDHMWPALIDPYLKKVGGGKLSYADIGRLRYCPCRSEHEEPCFCLELSYGMNQRCGGYFLGEKPVVVPLKIIRYPQSTIRMAEVRWDAGHGSLLAARPSEFKPDDPTCHLFPTWHMGKGNVLWIDGHVSSMTQKQYNMRDKGPYDGNIWLRLEGPKPPVP